MTGAIYNSDCDELIISGRSFLKYMGKTRHLPLYPLIQLTIIVFLLWNTATAEIIDVQPGDLIQTALEQAAEGDTLMVHGGYYDEHDLEVVKKLTLLGENNPVIDGEGKHHILTIRSDEVTIRGFEFRNAGISFIHENAAIKLTNVKQCTISDNRFSDNFFAIYLANSSDCRVTHNNISAKAERETSSGNGIHLWYCKNITIEKNHITGHRDGIYMEFVEDTKIAGNLSEGNIRYGLHFMFSNSCQYRQNIFRRNGAGVAVMYTKSVIMSENHFDNNWGPASYGLLLKDIRDSLIEENVFTQNSIGLYTEGSNRITIQKNLFQGNGWAVKIMANSMDNVFTRNDFVNNAFDVATNSRQNFNTFTGNYWNRYRGYDLNSDGTGDVPFRPVRLFSLIVENEHTALILLKSFFIDLLDMAESVFPVLTPETLTDQNPKMKRIL